MLDPRIYRAGLIPVLLALVVAAFSLQSPPRPAATTLPPDAFDGQRAFATLSDLARTYPQRRPGSAGDRALAEHVATAFRAAGLEVTSHTVHDARTIDGERDLRTVVAVRPGVSDERIVLLAHRDAATGPATAELSGTAALLELARVYADRTLGKTLVLVSTSGGSGGDAGAAGWADGADGAQVDAVLVLGDLAGPLGHTPVVVPWSNSEAVAPLALRRTVETALHAELGRIPGETRGPGQLARLALPLTVGEQGALGRRGLPAVLVQASGERGPGAGTAVDEDRLGAFGRAILRSVSALGTDGATVGRPRPELLVRAKVVPAWAVRLLVGALILPVLFALIDGLARVRRRRERVAMWLRWVGIVAVPFVLALLVAYLLALTGAIAVAPPAPVAPELVPPGGRGAAILGVLALVVVLGAAALRPLLLRLATVAPASGDEGRRGRPGAAAAVLLALCALTIVVWAANPFAALLLLAPLHLWMLALAPDLRLRRPAALALVLVALVPLALAVGYDASRLGAGPLDVPWQALLLVAGGTVGPLAALVWALLAGLLCCVVTIVVARGGPSGEHGADAPALVTRGPRSYAGPGSLGGTDSALRR